MRFSVEKKRAKKIKEKVSTNISRKMETCEMISEVHASHGGGSGDEETHAHSHVCTCVFVPVTGEDCWWGGLHGCGRKS